MSKEIPSTQDGDVALEIEHSGATELNAGDKKPSSQKQDSGMDGDRAGNPVDQSASLIYGGNIAAACFATNAAAARPQADLSDEQQRRRRLQMNRANAQRNRDRKRIMIDMLQAEKDSLAASNAHLNQWNQELRSVIDAIKIKKSLDDQSSRSLKVSDSLPLAANSRERRKTDLSVFPAGNDDGQIAHQRHLIPHHLNHLPSAGSLLNRDSLVNAMARDLLAQEELLARRLSQATTWTGEAHFVLMPASNDRLHETQPLDARNILRLSLLGLQPSNNTLYPTVLQAWGRQFPNSISQTTSPAQQDRGQVSHLLDFQFARPPGVDRENDEAFEAPVTSSLLRHGGEEIFEVPARAALLSSIIPREEPTPGFAMQLPNSAAPSMTSELPFSRQAGQEEKPDEANLQRKRAKFT